MSVILAEFVSPFPTFSASLALNFLQIQPDCPDFSAVFVSACGTNTTYLSTESLFWWSILCMTLLISRNSVWLQSRLSMWYDIFFFILTKTFIYSETFLLRVGCLFIFMSEQQENSSSPIALICYSVCLVWPISMSLRGFFFLFVEVFQK